MKGPTTTTTIYYMHIANQPKETILSIFPHKKLNFQFHSLVLLGACA
jgi:hypothetical protein